MLNHYRTNAGWVSPNECNAIADLVGKRDGALDADKRYQSSGKTSARTYRTHSTVHVQSAIGRIRCAIARVFPQYDHATIGAISRQIMKMARHVRLDVDNPNTHLAFSPGSVNAHDTKGRRSLTFAKFIRRKCAELFANRLALADSAVENAQTAFQLVVAFPLKLAIVTGAAAHAIYADSDNGICSCMSGNDEKSDIVRHHFCANANTLQLITARSGAQLMIRAKLFESQEKTEVPGVRKVVYFLDRVYWHSSGALSDVREAELREWIISWLATQGIEVSETYDIRLRHEQGEPMPYLDRARQFDRDGNHIRLWSRGEFSADNTDGTDPSMEENDDRSCCDCCGERVDDDDIRCPDHGGCYCESCYYERYTWDDINETDISADDAICAIRIRRGREEEVYTDINNCREMHDGRYGYEDDIVELHNGEYALRTEVTELYDDTFALDSNDLVHLHDGEWALADDTDLVETNDEQYALIGDCVEITDDYGSIVYLLACDALVCV